MTETRIHPDTGEVLYRDVRKQIVAFGQMSESVEVPGWYSEGNGGSIHTAADLKAANETYIKLRSAYRGEET